MADGNDGKYEANSFNANGDDSSGATEKQLGKAGRKKRPCCCVPGIKKKCKSCLLQQQLNSTAYRNRQKDDIVQYRKERDEERSKVASLKGQLEAYQSSFTDSLQQHSRLCSNCGIAVDPVMLASGVPSGGTYAADAQTKLSEFEKFLQGQKNRPQTRKNPRAREACAVCTDETCETCKRRSKDRKNAQKSRSSRQEDFTECQKHLRWAIEYIHQQEQQKAELLWQNVQMKQLLTRRCHNCGWLYGEVVCAPVDPRSTDFQANPSQTPSTSVLPVGGGFQQQGQTACWPSQYLTPASTPPEPVHAQSVGHRMPGMLPAYDDLYGPWPSCRSDMTELEELPTFHHFSSRSD